MWTEITRPNYERRGRALRKRPDGSRVGVDRAAHAAAQEDRPAEDDGPAPCHGCGHVHGLDGLPVGDVAERLPSAFPRSSAIFYDWRSNGLLESINHHLVMAARELEGREAGPSAGVRMLARPAFLSLRTRRGKTYSYRSSARK